MHFVHLIFSQRIIAILCGAVRKPDPNTNMLKGRDYMCGDDLTLGGMIAVAVRFVGRRVEEGKIVECLTIEC